MTMMVQPDLINIFWVYDSNLVIGSAPMNGFLWGFVKGTIQYNE